MSDDKARLHRQLVKLGDMIGDGLADEPGGEWIRKEYSQVMRSLGIIPPRKRRPRPEGVNDKINEVMATRITEEECPSCKRFSLKQTRKGSMSAKCTLCGRSFKLLRMGKA